MFTVTKLLILLPCALQATAHAISGRQTAQVITACTKPNTAAITFDDGPYIYLNDIVNTLNAAGAKATFFFNGNNYDCIYNTGPASRVKYAYDNGHQVASHTWAHANLGNIASKSEMTSQFERTETAIKKITGAQVAMTRPPYGSYNNLALQVAAERQQKIILWDFDSGDSTGATTSDSIGRYTTVTQNRPSNILTLNHETYYGTAYNVLPNAITQLKAAGYQLVTVAECLNLPAYLNTGSASTRDSTWHC